MLIAFPNFSGLNAHGRFLVIPEDVPAGLATIYGFAPLLHKGIVWTKVLLTYSNRFSIVD